LRRWRHGEKGGQSAQALGRSRGGFTTKVHLLVDALGNPLNFILTAGNVADITQAQALLAEHRCQYVIADRGYDADKLLCYIHDRGAEPVIPPRSNRIVQRTYDKHLYRERHLVECFINKLKYYRRICTRFDKLASRYRGFLCFAAALIWLR
jgi:transposase